MPFPRMVEFVCEDGSIGSVDEYTYAEYCHILGPKLETEGEES